MSSAVLVQEISEDGLKQNVSSSRRDHQIPFSLNSLSSSILIEKSSCETYQIMGLEIDKSLYIRGKKKNIKLVNAVKCLVGHIYICFIFLCLFIYQHTGAKNQSTHILDSITGLLVF